MKLGRRRSIWPVLAGVLAVSAACSASPAERPSIGADPPTAPTEASGTGRSPATSAPPLPSATVPPVDIAPGVCGGDGDRNVVLGTVANIALSEASGLAASRTHDGALWSHNDGGEAVLYGFGDDGTDLGGHQLIGVDAIDIEDMAIIGGTAGDEVLLADIGDNRLKRTSIQLFRFPEPDPMLPGPITEVDVVEYTYPDGPHNAETLLVDEAARRVVIVTKEQQTDAGEPDVRGATLPSFVFDGPIDRDESGPIELRLIGMIDTPRLSAMTTSLFMHPASALGFGGVPTGGDVSMDGALVALRTYEAVWVWQRGDAQSVAEALGADPCEVTSVFEPQGEAIAFLDDTLLTLSEGTNPPIDQLGR